jgi:hypothetical protein
MLLGLGSYLVSRQPSRARSYFYILFYVPYLLAGGTGLFWMGPLHCPARQTRRNGIKIG